MKFPDISTLYALFKQHAVIITDSRKACHGSIFFALKGDKFNGNQFADAAIKQGCNYVVIDEEKYYSNEKCILVDDCLKALQDLAQYHRTHLTIPIVAITGSNGKTTTKEFIKNIVSKKYKTLATAGNLNNHIGVPLTLLAIDASIEIAIIEMGANHIGEIAQLCEIARPDYGLITNIGKAHIGEFGSFEAIVQAKTELYAFLKKQEGKVFVNSSDPVLMTASGDMDRITYGNSLNDFCTCQFMESNLFLKIRYANETIASRLIGKYNFGNIASAICIGKYFGVGVNDTKQAIEEYAPTNNRSQIVHSKTNTLILDAYNANPSSMKASIENFYDMEGENKWLILGDMLELGKYELEEHIGILQLIMEKNFQNIILVGKIFSQAIQRMELNLTNQITYLYTEELITRLKNNSPVTTPSLILIKGSRGIKLETIIEFL